MLGKISGKSCIVLHRWVTSTPRSETQEEFQNEVVGRFGFGLGNGSGERLLDFCGINNLVVATTLFQKSKEADAGHGNLQMVKLTIELIVSWCPEGGTAV